MKFTETALPIEKGRGFTNDEVKELKKRGFTVVKDEVKIKAKSLAYKQDEIGANVEAYANEHDRVTGIAYKVSDWSKQTDFTGFDQGLIIMKECNEDEVVKAIQEALLKCPV